MDAPPAKPRFKSVPLILPISYNYNPATNEVSASDRKAKGLKPVEEGVRILSSIRGPVAVISIVGAYRKGKSYFLSRLLGSSDAFELGATSDPKTIGIWIGTQTIPHKARNADGSMVDCTVVLIDTEGLDSVQGDQHRDNAIFMLTVMLSSLLVYNNAGVPTEKDLDGMAFILKTVRSFAARSGGKAGEGDVKEYFPDLLWLLRDFHLDLVKDGEKCTADEYLQSVLRQTEGAGDEDERRNAIRKGIHFFRTQHCATVPHPGVDPESLKHLERIAIDKLPAEFNKDLEAAKARVFSLVTTKRAPASPGRWVTASGDLVAAFMLELIKAVNEPNTVPVLEPMFLQAFRSAMSKTLDRALTQYRTAMEAYVTQNPLPVESKALMDAHEKAMSAALQLFQKEVPACDPKLVTEYGARLVQQVADFGASNSARKPEFCRLWTEPPSPQPKKWTSQAEEHMMRWCESVGFKVLPMPPDGNCGFHAYIKLMTDAEKARLKVTDVESLRRVIADAMAGPLLERLRTLPNFAGESLPARVDRVRSGGEGAEYWAGEDTHLALAFLLERPVTVVTCFDSLRPLILPHPSDPKDWDPAHAPTQEQADKFTDLSSNALFVLYLNGNHYKGLERAAPQAAAKPAEAAEAEPMCPKCKKEALRPGATFCNACHEAVAAPRNVELKRRLNEALKPRTDEEARKKDARAALAELTKAIEADPADGDLYHLRGEAYSVLGEQENAIKDWDEALRRQRSVRGGILYEFVVRNEKASEQHCNLALETLYKPIHDAIAKAEITFAEFEQRIDRMREEYDRVGRGPMKGIAASKFLARLLQQDGELLKNLRGFKEEAKQAMHKRNEAEAKAQAAEDKARQAAEQRDRVAIQQREEMQLMFQQQQAMQENMMKEMRNAAEKDRERATQLQKAMLDAQAENAKRQAEQQEKMVAAMTKMMADAQKQHTESMEKMLQAIKSMPPPQVHVSGGCLLADAVVRLRDGRRVLLGAVRVGDWVESADNEGRCVYSQVYFNATHRSNARVVVVTASDPRDPSQPCKRLELTDDHLLYVSPAQNAPACGAPMAAGKVAVGGWVWARDEGETVLRPWRIAAVTAQERPCLLQNVLVLNNCLVADGVLASCFTINHAWEVVDSLPLRALFYVRPSLLESAAVQKAVHSYDTVVEGAVKYALSWLGM